MIVVDTSIFIDLIFEYNEKRTSDAETFFNFVQDTNMKQFEPNIFKIELISQLSRRLKENEGLKVYNKFIEGIEFTTTAEIFDLAFDIGFHSGARAIDTLYIATAKLKNSVLISNDKVQVQNAKNSNIIAFYLIDELDKALKYDYT